MSDAQPHPDATGGSSRQLGSSFAEALIYATQLHAGQTRKGTEIPYISHLLAVAALVIEDGGSEEEAIAALLHDSAEDQGGEATLSEIQTRFGEQVAEIVRACSDTTVRPKPPWRERRERYLEHLETASQSVLRVSLADKLHNAGAILRDYQAVGDEVWNRFRVKAPEQQLWYYRRLADVFARRSKSPMAGQLAQVVSELERLMAQTPTRTQQPEPLQELDEIITGIADALGAKVHRVGLAAAQEHTDAFNNVLRLVGRAKVQHTITRDGRVIVPVDDGWVDIVLDTRELAGEEWINLAILLLIDLSPDPGIQRQVAELLAEANLYYGAKFIYLPEAGTLQLLADIPCDGLDTPQLCAIMRRMVRVARDVTPELEKLRAGHRPGSVFHRLGYRIEHSFKTPVSE